MMFIVAIILVHLAGKGLSEESVWESNRWKPITSTNDQRPMSSRFYYVVLPKSLLYGQSFDILNTQSDRKFKGQLQTVDQQENNHEIQQQHQDLSYNQHQQEQALQFNPQQRYNDQIDSSVSQHQKGFDPQVQEQQHRGYEGQHQQPQEIRFHNEQQLNYGNEGEQQQKEFTLQNQQQQNNGYEGQQQQQENGFQNQQQQTHGYEGQEKQQQQEIRFQKQQRQEQLGNQGQRQFGYQAKKTTDVLDNRHNNGGYHIKVGKYTANVHPQSRAPQPVDQLTFFRTPEQPNKVEIAPLKPPELPKVDRPNIPLFQAERPSVIPPVPGQLVNQQPLISFQSVDKRPPSVTSATFRPPVIPPIPDRSVIPPVPVQLTTKRPLVEFPPQFPGRQVVIPPRPKDISQGFCTCKSSCSPQSNIPSNIGTLSFQQAAASLEADAVLSLIRLDEESIIALLSDEGPYTLFLPSNNALSRLPPQLLKIWKEDSDTFTKIFLNHIIPTKLSLEDLRQTPTIDPRAANVDTLYVNSNEDETVTINGQRIVTTNAPGPKGGMIHVIDGVLYPLADKDIVDTVIQCNKFGGFLTLLEGTQLIDTLRRDGPFTLFLPSDDALSKIPENELDVLRRNITALRAFLLYHMVEGVHYGADLRDAQYLTSLYQSQPVRVSVNVDGCRRRLYEANNSPLYRADIPARNGVIHVVDWVLKLEDLETCDGVILP